MRNLLVIILLALAVSPAQALILNAPFQPEVDSRFNNLEKIVSPTGTYAVQDQAGNSGLFTSKTAKAIITLTGDVAGTYNTGIVLPAYATIKNSYVFVKTAILPSGTTVALKCVSTGDIFAAADKTGTAAGGFFAGIQTGGAPSTYINSGSSPCTVKITTAVHTATAGVIDLFLDYDVAN